ncbi:hypothetical protein DKL51_28065, partial [Micromonospora globispora]
MDVGRTDGVTTVPPVVGPGIVAAPEVGAPGTEPGKLPGTGVPVAPGPRVGVAEATGAPRPVDGVGSPDSVEPAAGPPSMSIPTTGRSPVDQRTVPATAARAT